MTFCALNLVMNLHHANPWQVFAHSFSTGGGLFLTALFVGESSFLLQMLLKNLLLLHVCELLLMCSCWKSTSLFYRHIYNVFSFSCSLWPLPSSIVTDLAAACKTLESKGALVRMLDESVSETFMLKYRWS